GSATATTRPGSARRRTSTRSHAIRRALLIAACAALALASPAHAAKSDSARGPGRAHYDLALSWNQGSHTLSGDERVTFVNTRRGPIRSVWLRLWANGLGSCDDRLIRMQIVSGGSQGRR